MLFEGGAVLFMTRQAGGLVFPPHPLLFSASSSSLQSFSAPLQSASEELGFDLDREIPIIYQRENTLADSLWSILPMAVLIGAWLFLTRRGKETEHVQGRTRKNRS